MSVAGAPSGAPSGAAAGPDLSEPRFGSVEPTVPRATHFLAPMGSRRDVVKRQEAVRRVCGEGTAWVAVAGPRSTIVNFRDGLGLGQVAQ